MEQRVNEAKEALRNAGYIGVLREYEGAICPSFLRYGNPLAVKAVQHITTHI